MKDDTVEMEEFLEAVSEPAACRHDNLVEFVAPTYQYAGSCLGPFLVHDASLRKCSACKMLFYSRAESKRWQVRKAIEIVSRTSPLTPLELRFIRQTAGLSVTELARILRIDKGTLSRWETRILTDAGRADLAIRAFFAVSLWLADMKEVASMVFPQPFLQRMAETRARFIKAALPGMELVNVQTITASLRSDFEGSEEQLLEDALMQERASIERIREGDETGYHYFANAKQFSGEGLREFLDLAASAEARKALHRFGSRS